MRIEPLDDPADPRFDVYRSIPDAGLRARRGLFVAESRDVVRRLLTSRFRTHSALLTQPALDSLRAELEAAPPAVVYLARHEVARTVVGYNFHRGCVALGERGVEPPPEEILDRPGPRIALALEDVSNPDNVGGIFRNARALGADAIVLSTGCADPLYRKSIRVSMGASLILPFAHVENWGAALRRLRETGHTLVALTPDPDAADIARAEPALARASRVVLLLGAEGHGLRGETRAAADLELRIAMAPDADSLNVATAAAIALHRLRHAR